VLHCGAEEVVKILCDEGYGQKLAKELGASCKKDATYFYLEYNSGTTSIPAPDNGVGLYAVCVDCAEHLADSFQKDALLLTEEEFQAALVMES
jgi:hypothetical protein